MAELLDMFAFLAVLLRGVTLALQTLIVGGIIYTFVVVKPLSVPFDSVAHCIRSSCRQTVTWSALALALTQSLYLCIQSAVLIEAASMKLNEVVGANFFLAGSATVLAALMIAAFGCTERQRTSWGLLMSGMIILSASVLTSHAFGRLEHGVFT